MAMEWRCTTFFGITQLDWIGIEGLEAYERMGLGLGLGLGLGRPVSVMWQDSSSSSLHALGNETGVSTYGSITNACIDSILNDVSPVWMYAARTSGEGCTYDLQGLWAEEIVRDVLKYVQVQAYQHRGLHPRNGPVM